MAAVGSCPTSDVVGSLPAKIYQITEADGMEVYTVFVLILPCESYILTISVPP